MYFTQIIVRDRVGNNISLNKPTFATQTHVQSPPPSVAVNGATAPTRWANPNVTNNVWHAGSNDRGNAYWQVDLGADYDIASIQYLGGTDCCFDRIPGLRFQVVPSNAARVFTLPNANIDQTITVNTIGRFVQVRPSLTSGDGFMFFTQIIVKDQAGNNISLNKPTFGTSLHGGGPPSSVAVNGTTTPQRFWDLKNVWHPATQNRDTEFWQVDLGQDYNISTIQHIGGNDCCADRFLGLRIQVIPSSIGGDWNDPRSTPTAPSLKETFSVNTNPPIH
jgi:hypothetical protein